MSRWLKGLWPESIKKRACRYLLQHYLGKFLLEKLTLDQLSVDLYNGTGHVNDVGLDIWSLNDMLAQAHAPVEFVDGYIGSIVVSIPWSSLLNDNCTVEIRGLEISMQATNRANVDLTAMSDSFYRSLGTMTTSMELAEECLKQDQEEDDQPVNEGPGLFDGLEVFAQTIESVLSRVKISLTDTVIRLEQFPNNAKSGVGVEIKIKRIDYFDEKTMSEESDHPEQGKTTKNNDGTFQRDVFACKRFQAMGITISLDEFYERSKAASHTSAESFKTGSPPLSPHSSLPVTIVCKDSKDENMSEEEDVRNGHRSTPTVIARCNGQQEIKIRVKQVETAPGPTIDAECYLGSCSIFLTPYQVHLLTDFAEGFVSTQQDSKVSDYAKETSDEQAKSPESLSLSPENDNRTRRNDDLEQFYSMAALPAITDLASELPPLGNPTTTVPMYFPNDETESEITDYSHNSYSTRYSASMTPSNVHTKKYSSTFPSRKDYLRPSETQSITSHYSKYQLKFSSLAVTVLHVNPLSDSNSEKSCTLEDFSSSVDEDDKFSTLSSMSEQYFTKCSISIGGLAGKGFPAIRQSLSEICCPHDHLRLLAQHIHLNCEQKGRKSRANLPLSASTTTDFTIGKMEITESLFCDQNKINTLSSCQKKKYKKCTLSEHYLIHSELLCFSNKSNPMTTFKSLYQTAIQNNDTESPNIKIRINQSTQQKSSRTSMQLSLSDCRSEIDISITDRLSTLINKPDSCIGRGSTNSSLFVPYAQQNNIHLANQQEFFNAAFDDVSDEKDNKVDVTFNATLFKIHFLFPIPDLRPDVERRPWYERSVRDEYAELCLKNACLETTFTTGNRNCDQSWKAEQMKQPMKEFKFKMEDLHILYAHKPNLPPQSFIRISSGTPDCEASVIANPDIDVPYFKVIIKSPINTTCNMQLQDNSIFQAGGPGLNSVNSNKQSKKEDNFYDEDFPMLNSFNSNEFETEFSPFSKQKHLYNDQERIMPGTSAEMQAFMDDTTINSKISITLNLPCVNVALVSADFVNNIYNRINNDLLLWEPTAPQPRKSHNKHDSFPESTYLHNVKHLDIGTQLNIHNSDDFSSDDSDSEDTSYQEQSHSQKKFRKSCRPFAPCKQSEISVTANISNGKIFVRCNNTKFNNNDKQLSEHGECVLFVEKLSVFNVTSYHGNPLLDFVCIKANACSVYHKPNIPNMSHFSLNVEPLVSTKPPDNLNPVLVKSTDEFLNSMGTGSSDNQHECRNMLLIAIKITTENDRPLKQCVIAASIYAATIHHAFLKPGQHALEQLIDFFDVVDDNVLGYTPPSFLTELHVHVNESAAVYEPLYMTPRIKSILTLGTFSLSSNLVAGSPLSVLHITFENAALHLRNKLSERNSLHSYVTVVAVNWFEVCLKLRNEVENDKKFTFPTIDFQASNNEIRITTCADSCAYLSALMVYLAEDGDLQGPCEEQSETSSTYPERQNLNNSSVSENGNFVEQKQDIDSDCESDHDHDLYDLMADAIKEKSVNDSNKKTGLMTESLYVPSSTNFGKFSADMSQSTYIPSKRQSDSDDDFCIIEGVNDEMSFEEMEPVIRKIPIDHQKNYIVQIHENHFKPSFGKTDELRAPDHFPKPVYRYLLKELTCIWIMYGGNDFEHKNSKQAFDTNDKQPSGRDMDTCMELHFNKVKLQHDQYPEDTHEAARTVLILSDFEFLDRLKTSRINKFLYRFHTSASPKQAHAKTFVLKALQIRPEGPFTSPECKLRISLQPLRFNVDQDTLLFLNKFFSTLTNTASDGGEENAYSLYETADGGSIAGTTTSPKSRRSYSTPVMSRPTSSFVGDVEEQKNKQPPNNNMEQPLFFKEVIFSPEVPIRLDYHGKRIATEHGTFAGLIMGLGQLNCSQLKLKKVTNRHGLLGADRVIMYLLREWSGDIRSNQLPSILGGVGPMHSVVQFFQGVKDLVWLPVEQYRKDGRLVRGLQRGATSFGTSTAMAMLEVTNKAVCLVQTAAETTYDIVSPADLHRRNRQLQRNWRTLGYQAAKKQPLDLREGLTNAVNVVKDGMNDAAVTIVEITQKEHERKGVTGAVGGLLRHLPPTLMRPVIMASEATSSVLSGMRNQIQPDAKKENEDKWRDPFDD